MNIQVLAVSIFLSAGALANSLSKETKESEVYEASQEEQAAPTGHLENLYDRQNNKMLENPRNPAMVKGFQRVGQDNSEDKLEEE